MKTLKLSCLSLLSGTSLLLISCATMKNGTTQEIHFDSNPQGAIVKGDKGEIGTTPFTKNIKRTSSGIFTFEKPGYQSDYIKVKKKVNKSSYANFALLPLWPVAHFIDGVTGGTYGFVDDTVTMELELIDETDAVDKAI